MLNSGQILIHFPNQCQDDEIFSNAVASTAWLGLLKVFRRSREMHTLALILTGLYFGQTTGFNNLF